MRLSLPIIIGFALLLMGADSSKNVGTDKHKAPSKKVEQTAQEQPPKPTPFEDEIRETLRGIKDQIKVDSEQYNASQKSWNSPSVWVQIALVIVGLAYTFFAACQWWATRILADLERPWLILETDKGWPFDGIDIIQGGFRATIGWSIVNVGRSPAFITDLATALVVADRPITDEYPSYPTGELPAEMILKPSGRHGTGRDITLSQSQVDDFIVGRVCVMLYGRVIYSDSSRNVRYISRFCCYWHMKQDPVHMMQYFIPIGPRRYIEYT